MSTTTPKASATELWNIVLKEITGIQLLWEAVNGLYFQPYGKGWLTWKTDDPLLIHLMQTALMESLLMRVSRMMDPTGTGNRTNLSLKRLVEADPSVGIHESAVRAIWDSSGLQTVRNKYLSHNDLNRSLSKEHTLNIPLESADIETLRQLAEGLRELTRNANRKLLGGAYVDQHFDAIVRGEIETLCKVILAGEAIFSELPDRLLAAGY